MCNVGTCAVAIVGTCIGTGAACVVVISLLASSRCRKEWASFTFLGPRVRDLIVKHYTFERHWTGMALLVMEDLGHLRSQKSRNPNGASVADATLLIQTAGRVHSRTWNDRDILTV